MISTYVSVMICVLGAFVYALSSNGKASQLGLYAFACGLLAALLTLGERPFHFP